ncbi:hypothetical protein CRG98_008342 [Punica granatum]|uniref:Uncharacterized protein n=1 Tax=Punica granatum TaxID=22663 RepID=A0A2I0KS94_PUNGR|nr:hypothetical protein CRG98_008342 [Punica granatum]
MSHRKVYSHGSIPFSWEDSPGVRKPATPGHDVQPYLVTPPSSDAIDTVVSKILPASPLAQKYAIPPPPRMLGALPRRTNSGKGFWGREADPFLTAYKECTKDAGTMAKCSGQIKKVPFAVLLLSGSRILAALLLSISEKLYIW